LTALAPSLGDRPVVSLAAGLRVSALQRQLPQGAAIGRIMPNVNVALGRGALLFAAGSLGEHAEAVHDVFALVGEVVPIDEDLFNAATAVAGSGPGFVALFIEALETAGVEAGLPALAARTLAQAVFAGTGLLVEEGGDAAAVKRGVCTPGGMTAAGVTALEERAVPAAIAAAVRAAIARAAELA
jgi:pyrroline-5-carboxylate reductase